MQHALIGNMLPLALQSLGIGDLQDERPSYDPRLLDWEKNVAWIHDTCCLGMNTRAEGDSK
jgi:hypothetical protein